jgi:outer membrane protein assembly factor BamB
VNRVFVTGMLAATLLSAGCWQSTPIEEIRANTAAVSAAADVTAKPGDWPWWYGPTSNGKAGEAKPGSDNSAAESPPLEWGPAKNIVWQAEVPGRGHASPIIAGQRVFIATADEAAEKQLLVCYDRKSGDEQWRTAIHEGSFLRMHQKNSHASATPACDGKLVFAAFINSGALRVTATDLDGKIVWQKEAGAFQSEHGYGSSPVLYKSLVIVCGDCAGSSFLAALDRETGDIVWRTARERPGRHGNYATPVVCQLAGKPQLLLHGHGKLTSYDPATGERLWYCDGPALVAACTIACSDELVFASGGYPEKEILAVRPDGAGDVTRTHVAWRANKGVTYVPSPVYHDGHLYVVADNGVASCFEAATGKQLWQERLGGNFSSSPVLADGKLFVMNEKGTTYVLQAAPKFKRIAENQLGETGFATPAIASGRIYLRSGGRLYCIGG